MSTPSPDPQKGELAYQSSEASEHALLSHVHACTCDKVPQEAAPNPPPHLQHLHHHHHHHHHHQVANKGPEGAPKAPPPPSCPCQDECDQIEHVEQIGQNVKSDEDRIEVSPMPPALPPRPPPRPRYEGSLGGRYRPRIANPSSSGIRKYVFWCCACGGLSTILGALFLAVYFLLRSYTSTLGYFETIPTFVPATMLILTGVCVMSLARRKNRYSYLIKVCGLCCLVCALTCVLVTITTTVIHMNRLQTLRECVYTQKTRTCTCYSVLLEAHTASDDGMRYVFDATPDCEVIHGALYSCLRAMFGLSVSGILVCIFSCMLVYQLLSHEKKKMYWEQLELRCRSFYQQHSGPPSNHGSVRGPPMPPATYCSCCEECRYPSVPAGPQVYPWESHHSTDRFWAPGRIGNFYSPNPEDVPPASADSNRGRALSGWSWRRLPWNRGNVGQNDTQRDNSLTYQGGMSSADSQYGFSSRPVGDGPMQDPMTGSTGSYSILDNRPPVGGVYVWGPPPPYSNPNSPARRPMQSPARYHHIHHTHAHESHCQLSDGGVVVSGQFRGGSRRARHHPKDNYENTTEPEIHVHPHVHHQADTSEGDTSSCADRNGPPPAHTLPTRKPKKRAEQPAKGQQGQHQEDGTKQEPEHDYHEPAVAGMGEHQGTKGGEGGREGQKCRFLPRLQGVENAAFQKQETSPEKPEPTESEVYFADVSSCCNISVRNDGHDSSLYDEALDSQKPRLMSLQQKQEPAVDANATQLLQNFQENISSSTVTEDEDYLAHRMGNRQMSTRSRMPFPLPQDLEYATESCAQLIPKDVSQNSLCSSVQTPLTETTDDAVSPDDCCGYFPENSFAKQQYLAPDAQYEVLPEQDNSSYRQGQSSLTTLGGFSYKMGIPKGRNMGSNISALIQNLGGNPGGLLYGEAGVEDEIQGQAGSHSDGTMDSGWQSGSEKNENRKQEGNNADRQEVSSKPVNV